MRAQAISVSLNVCTGVAAQVLPYLQNRLLATVVDYLGAARDPPLGNFPQRGTFTITRASSISIKAQLIFSKIC